MSHLKGKVALVTGSTRGIGRSIASRLVADGATVVITGRDQSQAQKVASEISGAGGRAIGLSLEVSDSEIVNHVIKKIEEEVGTVDVLVNNAGVTRDGLLLRMKDEDFDDVWQINTASAFRTSRAVLRGMMRKRWGRIINVSSIVGLIGNPGQSNYAASKAALVGFTKSLSREVATRGITVNAVAPGFIESDMTAALDEVQRDAMAQRIPMGRIGLPEEVAGCVAFLASDDAAYVTGHTLVVDGGLAM